ncbi:MAG: 3-deoxy-manno-octulosonate cytidylyltransferase [Candidatus Omnitrophota bacterium]
MDVIGVIPARYSSTRFEGKVLADIAGKPMLQHVWERAKESPLLDELVIATDDERIMRAVSEFGAKAVMTARGHASGTDRIVEVVNPIDVKVIINIQGDEPLIHPTMIDSVARTLLADTALHMATIIRKIDNEEELRDPNVVKVVTDKNNFALYFSRATIPYQGHGQEIKSVAYYKHIGLYGYTKDFLFTYRNLPPSSLEKIERLEQLRVLENGYRIKTVETKFDTISVDTPEDISKIAEYLKREKPNA